MKLALVWALWLSMGLCAMLYVRLAIFTPTNTVTPMLLDFLYLHLEQLCEYNILYSVEADYFLVALL